MLEVEAVYENGILKLDQPLPLKDQQRVRVIVQEQPSRVRRAYGLIGWQGDPEVLRQIALDEEFAPESAP